MPSILVCDVEQIKLATFIKHSLAIIEIHLSLWLALTSIVFSTVDISTELQESLLDLWCCKGWVMSLDHIATWPRWLQEYKKWSVFQSTTLEAAMLLAYYHHPNKPETTELVFPHLVAEPSDRHNKELKLFREFKGKPGSKPWVPNWSSVYWFLRQIKALKTINNSNQI